MHRDLRILARWAWVKALARGSEVLVVSLALADGTPRYVAPALHACYRARKSIAQEVVTSFTVEGCSLVELQGAVLRGLELELAAASGWAGLDPEELAGLVVEALHAYRDRSRR